MIKRIAFRKVDIHQGYTGASEAVYEVTDKNGNTGLAHHYHAWHKSFTTQQFLTAEPKIFEYLKSQIVGTPMAYKEFCEDTPGIPDDLKIFEEAKETAKYYVYG